MLSTVDIASLGWNLDSVYASGVKVFTKTKGEFSYEFTFYGEAQSPTEDIHIYKMWYNIDEKRMTETYFRGKCPDKATLVLLLSLIIT